MIFVLKKKNNNDKMNEHEIWLSNWRIVSVGFKCDHFVCPILMADFLN